MKRLVCFVAVAAALWGQGRGPGGGGQRPGATQGAGGSQQAPAATKPEDLATVSGTVVNAATGEALRKVTLSLRRAEGGGPGGPGGPRAYGAATDASGAFTIPNVEPGSYRLTAKRSGFVDADYGSRDYLRAGSVIPLAAKQRLENLRVSMQPNAVITGKVVDEDGDPMMSMEVEALRYRYTNGRKQLVSYGSDTTNDIGEYRIAGLPPGRYYIAASSRRGGGFGIDRFGRPMAAPAESDEYVRTFYPGTVDAAGAAPLEASPGVQLSKVDLAMAKKRTVTVKGKVTDATGATAQPNGRARVMVFLRPRELGSMGSNRPGMVDAAGNFEFRSIAPGSYDLVATVPTRGAALSSRIPVEVGHASIDNLRITVNPPLTVSGTVKLESQSLTLGAGAQVTLRPRESGGPFGGGSPNAKVGADGAFQIEQVSPDHYLLSVSGLPDGCYVKSVRVGTVPASLADVDFSQGGGALEIVVSPTAGLVTGVVQNDQQQPAGGASVVLVPQEAERRGIAAYYKTATADDTGHFTVKNLEPGQYKVYAWPDVEAGAYLDPDFLNPVEARGEAVTVKESGSENVQVRLIS